MPPPIPRCSNWAYSSLNSPSCFSLPRYGSRIGLHIFLFEACSTFTRVAACILALSPIRDTLIEGFSHFVTSMTAPIASGWSGCRVGFDRSGLCHNDVWRQPDQFRHILINRLQIGPGKPILDLNVAPFDPSHVAHTQLKCLDAVYRFGVFFGEAK